MHVLQQNSKWTLLVASVLLLAPLLADSHGLLYNPPGRNWKAYLNRQTDWAHQLNGGGKYKVSDNCKHTWPKGLAGLCGDEPGQARWMNPTAPKTYKAGQLVKLQVILSTNHGGRFAFSICPADAKDSSKCFKLNRADGRGQFFYLPRIRAYNGGATGEAAIPTERGPISSWSWFSMPHTNCGAGKYCDQFMGNAVYEIRYRLPKDFTCDRCVLQWHYLTGNSCWPPCSREDPTFPNCRAPTYSIPYCGTQGAAYPEEFWNCADIRIRA